MGRFIEHFVSYTDVDMENGLLQCCSFVVFGGFVCFVRTSVSFTLIAKVSTGNFKLAVLKVLL